MQWYVLKEIHEGELKQCMVLTRNHKSIIW